MEGATGIRKKIASLNVTERVLSAKLPRNIGEMAERPIVQHWKCCVLERGPGVRIPLSPLLLAARESNLWTYGHLRFLSLSESSRL